jgi:hypothetical protein
LNTNVGTADRVVRVVIGLALLSALFLVNGNARWFGLIGIVPLLTAAVSFCPLYAVLGIRSSPAAKPGP